MKALVEKHPMVTVSSKSGFPTDSSFLLTQPQMCTVETEARGETSYFKEVMLLRKRRIAGPGPRWAAESLELRTPSRGDFYEDTMTFRTPFEPAQRGGSSRHSCSCTR